MKKSLKYSHIFYITLALLILNIIPLIIFRSQIQISTISIVMIALAGIIILNGVFACSLKHKGNFLVIGQYRHAAFSEDKDYTFTDEYEREFRWMLLVYCMAIPFYLPVICFAANWEQTLWALALFLAPQLIYVIHGIYQTVQVVKETKRREAQLQKEREEQEKREELGYWK